MWRKHAVSVLALLMGIMCSGGVVRGQESVSPYVAFWNLENYFDPFDDSLTVDEEFTPAGEKHWTWKKFLVKRNLIAKALLSMHDRYGEWPLAVGFAEVENRMVLRQLTEQTPLAKLGYGVVHRDSPDSRGIDVGFIYREEYMTVLEVEARAVLTGRERPTRDILQVTAGLYLESLAQHKKALSILSVSDHFFKPEALTAQYEENGSMQFSGTLSVEGELLPDFEVEYWFD